MLLGERRAAMKVSSSSERIPLLHCSTAQHRLIIQPLLAHRLLKRFPRACVVPVWGVYEVCVCGNVLRTSNTKPNSVVDMNFISDFFSFFVFYSNVMFLHKSAKKWRDSEFSGKILALFLFEEEK